MDQPDVGKLMTRIFTVTAGIALGAVSLSTMWYGAAIAQTERLPGVIDRPQIEVPAEVTEPVKVEPKKGPEMEQPQAPAELVATLKAIKFEGDVILDERLLQKTAEPYLNRPLTRQDVARLKYDITKLYYDKGYVLVKVTTPPQDLSGGVMKVVVYAGRIGDIEISGKGVHPSISKSMTSGLEKGEVFNEQSVETAVRDIDDLGSVSARLNLKPGREFATTDLLLVTEPAREDVQQFTLDNYGSELTGRIVGTLDLRKSNLLGLGESVRLYLRQSEEDLTTIMGEFKTPVGLRNLFLELSYLWSENGIHDRLAFLRAEGETERFSVALSGNLINMLQRQLSWRAGIETRTHKSFLFGQPESEDDITQAYAELAYLLRKPSYVFYSNFRVTKGVDIWGADRKGDVNASRGGGDPQAWRLLPTLYANIRLAERDYLQTIVQGQVASNVLLASDLFVLGGYGSVRGFEPAQETGESGVLFNVDYNHTFYSSAKWDIKAGPFFDGGTVANRIKGSAVDSNLYSIGVGAEVSVKPFKFGESILRFDWAHPVGSYESPQVEDNTFYVRFTQTFVF